MSVSFRHLPHAVHIFA